MSARTAVIGLDACDPSVAAELMAAGRMPHLASITAQAERRPLVPPLGLFVGSIWPSILTGLGPAGHGIYSWRQFSTGSFATHRVHPAERRGASVWESLADAGAEVAVVDPPLSAPVEGRAEQIIDWGSHDRWLAPTAVGPIATEAMHAAGDHPMSRGCDHASRTLDSAQLRDVLFDGTDVQGRLAAEVLDAGHWDLFLTVLAATHCAGHHLWHHHDDGHVDHDPASLDSLGGDPVADVYERVDRSLGLLLERVDDDTTLFVVCSHGMVPHYGGDHVLAEALAGIEAAIAPATAARRLLGRGYRVGHAAQKRLRARFAGGDRTIQSLDGSRAFFQIPNNERFGAIRLNRIGREPLGIIDPCSQEGGALVEALISELHELRDPVDGRRVVTRVLTVDDHHHGDRRDALPDLLVDWDWSRPITAVTSPALGRIVEGHYGGRRSGDHRPAGTVWVRRGRSEGSTVETDERTGAVRTEDLAPTIAASLDHTMTGPDGTPLDGVSFW